MKSVCVPRKTFLTFAQFDFCQLFAAVSSGEKVLQRIHIPQLEHDLTGMSMSASYRRTCTCQKRRTRLMSKRYARQKAQKATAAGSAFD